MSVTDLKHRYLTSVITKAWWNIIIFHSFYVLVTILVFAVTLYNAKIKIFGAFGRMLTLLVAGEPLDPEVIAQVSQEVDTMVLIVLIGIFLFSLIIGIIAANITLAPTRKAFAIQKKFIATIAHELRTPLAILRTQNEVALYDIPRDSPTTEVIQDNINETKHLTNILNNLLLFNRIDTSEGISFETVNLKKTIELVCSKLEKLANRRRVIIKTSLQAIPDIYANQTAIEQALYNIIKNAIIYSKASGGNIDIILTHTDDNQALITISDTGIGIKQDKLKHIFEPFFRADERLVAAEPGSGLGLALVLEIIKLHQGSVTVESTEDIGSTIKVELPIWLKIKGNKGFDKAGRVYFDFKK